MNHNHLLFCSVSSKIKIKIKRTNLSRTWPCICYLGEADDEVPKPGGDAGRLLELGSNWFGESPESESAELDHGEYHHPCLLPLG